MTQCLLKGDKMCCLLKDTMLACGILFNAAGFLHAGHDASLPEINVGNPIINMVPISLSLTPPVIGAFAAPDGAMRGLAYDGTYLWAANSGDGNSMYGAKIYRLDPDSGTVINSYNGIADYPCGLAWDGQYLWHSAYIAGMIYQLDTANMSVVKSFAAPTTHPFDLAFYGGLLYAVKGNQPCISVIDTSTGLEIDSIAATYSSPNVRPFGLTCVIRSAPQLWTSDGNYGSNLVNSWNVYTNAWVDQWAAEPTTYPSGIAYDSVNERMWVSCYNRDSIYIYDVSQVAITEDEIGDVSGYQIEAHPNPFTHTTKIRFMIHACPASPSANRRGQAQGEVGDTGCMEQKIRNSNIEMRKHTIANQSVSGSVGIVSEDQRPELRVYDAAGRAVKFFTLPATYCVLPTEISWDGTDEANRKLPAGVYFLKALMIGRAVKLVKSE